jgi:hypothetical protein
MNAVFKELCQIVQHAYRRGQLVSGRHKELFELVCRVLERPNQCRDLDAEMVDIITGKSSGGRMMRNSLGRRMIRLAI